MNQLKFLSKGGEMGALIREKDWSQTSIGNPETWPQSLRTTLSILLSSKFPGFIFWGKDHLCFYNDAYRPSLGNDGKHPHILGLNGKEAWPEIWDIIKPLIDQVLNTGEATWSEDQLIPIFRNNRLEDIYWTFSYSPIYDESDSIAGVLTTCLETTKEVMARKELEKTIDHYHENIMQAPIAMCIFKGDKYIVEIANQLMLELWGKEADQVLGKPIFEGLPDAKGQGLEEIMNQVYHRGEKYEASERLVSLSKNGILENFYLNFVYQPIKDAKGAVKGIIAMSTNVTEQVLSRKKIEENEEKLNLVIEDSKLGIWEFDFKVNNGVFTDRYAQIFGCENKDNLDRNKILLLLHPDDKNIRDLADSNLIKTGYLNYESRIFWEDGSIHWIQVNGTLFYDQDKPSKMIGTIRDITDEKKYEKDLIEREEKFRLLADEMPQFVWTGDVDGNLSYFNKSVYKYSGLDECTISNGKWIQIVHPDDREQNIQLWINAVTTGHDFVFEHRFKRHDGEYRWQLSRAKPQKDKDGIIQMWIGTSTDIHDIKEMDDQKDFFISMASHELKTPITSVKGYVQLLQSKYKKSDDVFLTNALSILNKQVGTLSSLITDLLDVSKIKSGSLLLKKTTFKINELVEDVIGEIQNINTKHQIIFCAEADAEVFADRENITQVLVNFLTNAIKYSPDSLNVDVKSSLEDNNMVKITVTDKGIGLNEEDRKKVFERFYRVEGKNEKTFPGFGIGLFIASEIIKKHEGLIGVDSKFGKGSSFYFLLPLEINT
nr:PAS domain S-box protein [Pseudopedobacter sp.]